MFEFYFQSGEFTRESGSMIKDFILPLLGVSIPLWIYYEGVKFEKKKEIQKQKIVENQKLKYLSQLIGNAIKSSKNFETRIETVIVGLNDRPITIPQLGQYTFEDIRRLVNEINREDFYYALLNNIRDESINSIFRILDTTFAIKNQVDSWYIELSNANFSTNKVIDDCKRKIVMELEHVSIIGQADQILKDKIDLIISDFIIIYAANNNKYDILKFELFQPIISVIKEGNGINKANWFSIQQDAVNGLQNIDLNLQDKAVTKKRLEKSLESMKKGNNGLIVHYEGLRSYSSTSRIS